MRKKNGFFKIIFIFCISIAGCNNQDAGKADFFEKGVALYEQGKFNKAKLEIKNAIKKHPKMAEAYYYLALLNEKESKFKAMKSNLIKTVKLDSLNTKARVKLAKVYLLFNELDEALKEVDQVLMKDPDQLDALALNASVLIKQQKIKEALAIIDGILQKNANHIDALSLKTALLIKEQSFDEALAIITPAIQNNEENISLRLLKTQIDSKRNDDNAVIEDYKKLVELKPDDIRIKYALVNAYIKSNKNKDAEDLLRNLVQDNHDLIEAKLVLLDFLYSKGADKAEKQLNIFVDEYTNNYKVLIKFSNWLISKGRDVRATEILNTVLTKEDISQKDKTTGNLILAKIEISKKRFNNGLTYIENILKVDAENPDAKLLKSKVFFANKNYDTASKLLEEILWQKPDMDQALSLLGSIDLIRGDLDKADANFKEALKRNPANLVALKFIVAKAVNEEHVDYGIELLQRALRFSPAKVGLLIKLIELNINEQNWDAANKYIEIIRQQKNGGLYAQFFRARVFQKQNENEKAIAVYKEILQNYPGFKDALAGMSESYLALKQQAKMMAYLDSVIQNQPNLIFPYILKSQLLAFDKKHLKAVKLLNTALKSQEIPDVSLFIELARQYALLGKEEAEYQTYIEAINHHSEAIKLRLHLASFHEKKNEFDRAVEQYDKILLINPGHNIAKNNLATILIDHYGKSEDIDKAVQLTKTFKQSRQPYFLDTYGWAQLTKGNIDKALPIFKKVILLAPDVPVFRYHLAVAFNTLGDSMSAVSELKQALNLGKVKEIPEKVLIEELLTKIENN